MKEKILDQEYEVTKISFGQYLECKDSATKVDINIPIPGDDGKFTGRYYEKMSDAILTRSLVKLMFKKAGKAVDINDKVQCPYQAGKAISARAGEIIAELNEAKNSSAESEPEATSLPSGD